MHSPRISRSPRRTRSPTKHAKKYGGESDGVEHATSVKAPSPTFVSKINCNLFGDIPRNDSEDGIVALSCKESSGSSTQGSASDTSESGRLDHSPVSNSANGSRASASYTNSVTTSFSRTTNATESVFRRRSPESANKEKRQGNWWSKSPRNVRPYRPKFQRFRSGQARDSIGIIQEVRSDEESSVLATMEESEQFSNQMPKTPFSERNTPLHELCSTATDLEQLWASVSLITPSACSQVDSKGRLPLHCLCNNQVLIDTIVYGARDTWGESSRNTQILRSSSSSTFEPDRIASPLQDQFIDFITQTFLEAHPASLITADAMGRIPFEDVLIDWVNQTTLSDQDESAMVRERFGYLWTKSIKLIGQSLYTATSSMTVTSRRSSVESAQIQNDIEIAQDAQDKTTDKTTRKQTSPSSKMRLTATSYFAFRMLSTILDFLLVAVEQKHGQPYEKIRSKPKHTSVLERLHESTLIDISREIVRSIASIPRLVYAVLVIEDSEQRRIVLNTSIMKQVMATRYSVGDWLTEMLQSSEQRVADCAIEYLQIVSNTTYEGDKSSYQRPTRESGKDEKQGKDARDDLAVEISNLDGFVPSLLSLSSRHVEEASTTKVVRSVLDEIISRPFCVTVIFCDAVFLALLISGFRLAVNHLIIGSTPTKVLQYVYMANIGLFYFMQRELGRIIGLLAVTKHARIYFFSFWNVIDLLSVLLALSSIIAIRRGLHDGEEQTDPSGIRNLLAVTTGFLWLRCLNFLKGVNMPLATFVLTIQQITKDVLWFCMIVLIMVIAFSQMFFTVLAPDSCASGDAENEDACKQSEYFLKTYMLLIFQEFDRENFTTSFSVVLAVIYSFMIVLVMLNVLIAVASDSYEKCLVRSDSLFGRARVMLIAELVCFQNLLRPSTEERTASAQIYKAWWSADWKMSGWTRASVVFFGLGIILLLTSVVGEVVVLLNGRYFGALGMSLASIAFTVCLFFGTYFFLSSEARIRSRTSFDEDGGGSSKSFCGGWLRNAMLQILGSSGDSSSAIDWKGRLLYLKEEMGRLAEENRLSNDEKMRSLEQRIQLDIADMKKSLSTMGEGLKPDTEAIHSTLRDVCLSLQALEKKVSSAT